MRKKTKIVFYIGTKNESTIKINDKEIELKSPISKNEIRQLNFDDPVDADVFGYTSIINPSEETLGILLKKEMPWFQVHREDVDDLYMESVLNFIRTPHKYNYFKSYSKKPLKNPNDYLDHIKKLYTSFPFEESNSFTEELVELGKKIIKFMRYPRNSELSNPWFVFLVNKALPLLANTGYYGIHAAITFIAKNVFQINKINSEMLPIILDLDDKYIYNILDETNVFAIESILTSSLDTARSTLSSIFALLVWGYNAAHHARFMEFAESASIFTRQAGMKEVWPMAIEKVCLTKGANEDEVLDFFRFIKFFDVENLSTNMLEKMQCPNVITQVCFNKVFNQGK